LTVIIFRSSVALHLNALRQIGGVNSIDNYVRSWQRAANFHEIAPVRPSFRFADDDESEHSYGREDIEGSPYAGQSMLRNALENQGRRVSEQVINDDQAPEGEEAGPTEHTPLRRQSSRVARIPESWTDSVFSVEPSLASVFGGSYGTMYASRASRASRQDASMRHAARIFNEEQLKKVQEPDQDREPLLVKYIEEDGETFNVVVGQSTLPQTIFNSVNVLIGVGLLSLPLALRYSGWVIGIIFFTFAVVSTRYTANLLAKCLDVDNSLVTFADLAYVSFGSNARIATCLLFTIELLAACVALVILFADSLDALIPGYGTLAWKGLCCVLLIPLSFLPLRLLSFTSVLGILSCLGSKGLSFRLVNLCLLIHS
jgi:vesicular inhibitory amino acid transporter